MPKTELLDVPMRSDEAAGVMFWQHKDDFGSALQHCNRLTVHTPHWCRKHALAHAGRCLACEKRVVSETTHDVAALFVDPKGPYWGRPDVDAWDEMRDARKYTGPHPVVAHPPCAAWCRLAGVREAVYGYPQGEDDGVFASALQSVRRWGGVLEHPAWTKAWVAHGLQDPPSHGGWHRCIDGSWVCQVSQAAYGHRARKLTWLYYVGGRPPAVLDWRMLDGECVISGSKNHYSAGHKRNGRGQRMWSNEAKRTPQEFAEVLLSLARNSGGDP